MSVERIYSRDQYEEAHGQIRPDDIAAGRVVVFPTYQGAEAVYIPAPLQETSSAGLESELTEARQRYEALHAKLARLVSARAEAEGVSVRELVERLGLDFELELPSDESTS